MCQAGQQLELVKRPQNKPRQLWYVDMLSYQNFLLSLCWASRGKLLQTDQHWQKVQVYNKRERERESDHLFLFFCHWKTRVQQVPKGKKTSSFHTTVSTFRSASRLNFFFAATAHCLKITQKVSKRENKERLCVRPLSFRPNNSGTPWPDFYETLHA